MQNDTTKSLAVSFVTLEVNTVVSFSSIFFYASYYTPGNPIRPNRIDVDLIGLIGFYIGISQILYLAPTLYILVRVRKGKWAEGVVLGVVITASLNVVFLLTFKP
jgi:hypothetical protein